jgi:hypothetical protein
METPLMINTLRTIIKTLRPTINQLIKWDKTKTNSTVPTLFIQSTPQSSLDIDILTLLLRIIYILTLYAFKVAICWTDLDLSTTQSAAFGLQFRNPQ